MTVKKSPFQMSYCVNYEGFSFHVVPFGKEAIGVKPVLTPYKNYDGKEVMQEFESQPEMVKNLIKYHFAKIAEAKKDPMLIAKIDQKAVERAKQWLKINPIRKLVLALQKVAGIIENLLPAKTEAAK